MEFAKLFRFGKKGAKFAKKKADGQVVVSEFEWPEGLRVGVYGHGNSGKTVFFTILNEDCKVARDLQLSVNDNVTAGEFLANYKKIWGMGTATGMGTVVDAREERKFPDPSKVDKVLQFTAIVDRSKKLPVVTYDYPGNAVAISQPHETSDKVTDFMAGVDGLLFFFDPKVLGAELECQAHVASFVNMLEQLAPLSRRLPIPVALVITKADTLPGFTNEQQSILVSGEDEPIVCEDYEIFLERILSSQRIASNPQWAGTVRDILVKLKDFLSVAVGRTLDFQIFFTSHTGDTPEKVGADVGRSIYKPPEKIRPIGVRKPLHWLLKAIVRNRRLTRLRKVTRYVAAIALAWLVLVSGVYLYHFSFRLARTTAIEDEILSRHNNDPLGTDQKEQEAIRSKYNAYERGWLVSRIFPDFKTPARQLAVLYSNLQSGTLTQKLDNVISMFTAVAADRNRWPTVRPSDGSLVPTDETRQVDSLLQTFLVGDTTTIIFTRAKRAHNYWNLFMQCVQQESDTSAWNTLFREIETDDRLYGQERSKEEIKLCQTLQAGKVETVREEQSKQAGVELGDVIDRINGNPDPAYRLGDAVKELEQIRGRLDPATQAADLAMIDNYLDAARKWNRKRTYTYRVAAAPPDGHLHIDVAPPGEEPDWDERDTWLPGPFEYSITWQPGWVIYIAYDDIKAEENWGRESTDKRVLSDKYSLFDMEGDITFNNVGKTATITFTPNSLESRLPVLKK